MITNYKYDKIFLFVYEKVFIYILVGIPSAIGTTSPVILDEALETRKAAVLATSSGNKSSFNRFWLSQLSLISPDSKFCNAQI